MPTEEDLYFSYKESLRDNCDVIFLLKTSYGKGSFPSMLCHLFNKESPVKDYFKEECRFLSKILLQFSEDTIKKDEIISSFFDAEGVLIGYSIPILLSMLYYRFEDDDKMYFSRLT